MRVAAICGDHPRNCTIVKFLLENPKINLVQIILFKRDKLIPKVPKNLSQNLKKLWKLHFKKRSMAENKYFKFSAKNFPKNIDIIEITKASDLENSEFLKKIKKLNLDACFISSAPILSKKTLKFFPAYTVNLHLGLIPNYKGSITMFWPFYFLEPNMAGTTFHVIGEHVDTGEIIHNNVPKLKLGDGLHEVSCKAIIAANKDIDLVVNFIERRLQKKILPKKDPTLRFKGKLFLSSDWKPEMLEIIYDFYKDNIVDLYLKGKLISKQPKLKKLKR